MRNGSIGHERKQLRAQADIGARTSNGDMVRVPVVKSIMEARHRVEV